MNSLERVLVVIPSFSPPATLPQFCQSLLKLQLPGILLIDDGSPPEFLPIFEECRALGVKILRGPKNLGKGEALRSAMRYILESSDWDAAIFCDDDGQHSPSDIFNIAFQGKLRNLPFLMGTRDLGKMPLKSFIGNFVMTKLLRLFWGLNLSDTQSGLRFVEKEVMAHLISIKNERFSFEMICLMKLFELGYEIHSMPIETIYFESNKRTRFKAMKDSALVFSCLLHRKKE
jgi:glycosyltransferase involved in cell wall biosynthesis